MTNELLVHKAATIERCVARAKEEYKKDPKSFSTDFTRQDAAVLNILCAYGAALDMSQHLVRRRQLGTPQTSREVFQFLADGDIISTELASQVSRMVGFRNLAVQDPTRLQLPIVEAIITESLDDFLTFTQTVLKHDATSA